MIAPEVVLSDVLERVERPVSVSTSETYHFMGVRSFGVGAFDAGERHGSETRYPSLRVVRDGDFVYPKLMAWEGAFAVVPPEFDGYVVSPEFCIFRSRDDLNIAYLGHLFRWPTTWERIAGASIGTNLRRRRLYPEDFLSKTIPLPPIDEQRAIAQRVEHLGRIGTRAQRLAAERMPGARAILDASIVRVFVELEGGEQRHLGSDIPIVSGGTPSSGNPFFLGGEIPWVTPTDLGALRGKDITRTARQLTEAGFDACSAVMIPPGSIVLSTRAPIGHVAIARIPLCTNQGCKSFITPDDMLPEFLYFAVRSKIEAFREAGSGTTFHEVSTTKLRGFAVPWVDVDRQNEIVSHLQAVERPSARLRDLLELAGVRGDALEASVLNAAFSGLI